MPGMCVSDTTLRVHSEAESWHCVRLHGYLSYDSRFARITVHRHTVQGTSYFSFSTCGAKDQKNRFIVAPHVEEKEMKFLVQEYDWSANGLVIKCQFVTIHVLEYKVLPSVVSEQRERMRKHFFVGRTANERSSPLRGWRSPTHKDLVLTHFSLIFSL